MRTCTLLICILLVCLAPRSNAQELRCPQDVTIGCENFDVEQPTIIDGTDLELIEQREFDNGGNACEEDLVTITYSLINAGGETVTTCQYRITVQPFIATPIFPRDTVVSGFHVDEIFNQPLFTDGLLPESSNECQVTYTFEDEFVSLFPNGFIFRNWAATNACTGQITIARQNIRLNDIPNNALSSMVRDCQDQQIFPEEINFQLNGDIIDPRSCFTPFDSLHNILNCLADSLSIDDSDILSIDIPQLNSPLIGINILDVIDLQRHILGLSRFQDDCQLEAADVNLDGRINGLDLLELTRLILGIYTEWPDTQPASRLIVNGESRNNLDFTISDFPLSRLDVVIINRGNVSAR